MFSQLLPFLISMSIESESSNLKVTPLGAGQECGRSCILAEYKSSRIMLDCGLNPAAEGRDALPYWEEAQLDLLNLILVSHYHYDHTAGLPLIVSANRASPYRGPIYMTQPTRAIVKRSIRSDVSNADDVQQFLSQIQVVEFYERVTYKGVTFWAIPAGHVLGACMWCIQFAPGVSLVYTGDYCMYPDSHLPGAAVPSFSPTCLVAESTFGSSVFESLESRERQLNQMIQQTIAKRGKILFPTTSLGRAQELLFILEKLWHNNKSLHDIPIYFIDSGAKQIMNMYKSYLGYQSDDLINFFRSRNRKPWDLKYVSLLTGIDWKNRPPSWAIGEKPAIVVCSPGMIQRGHSRKFFELWCGDANNLLVMISYCTPPTLGYDLLLDRTDAAEQKVGKPIRMQCETITFSSHTDFTGTMKLVNGCTPDNIVLIHGSKNRGESLASAITRNRKIRMNVFVPGNTQTVTIPVEASNEVFITHDQHAKLVEEGTNCGVFVRNGPSLTFTSPEELKNTSLPFIEMVGSFRTKKTVTTEQLHKFFINTPHDYDEESFLFGGDLNVSVLYDVDSISVEWAGGENNYCVAMILASLLSGVESEAITITEEPVVEELSLIERLESGLGVDVTENNGVLSMVVFEHIVTINDGSVTCDNADIRAMVSGIIQ
ncbi:hypothetical protein PCE1_002870 [Barthelona sp. PCE]